VWSLEPPAEVRPASRAAHPSRGGGADEAQLALIEQRLAAADPQLAAFLSGATRVRHYRRAVLAVFAVAPAVIVAGLASRELPAVLVGVALMPVTPVAAGLVARRCRDRTVVWRRWVRGLRGDADGACS